MLTVWGVVTAVTVYGAVPALVGLWTFERRRSRRRNRGGQCASCGTEWRSVPTDDPYLIHGRLVCEPCGARARRRMPWHFGALAVATGIGSTLALVGSDFAVMALVPVGSTVTMVVGAVQLMKFANRRAQRRIARGDFPDIDTLRALAPEAGKGG